MHRSARRSPGLTGRPSGHPKGVAFWPPLNFNVRPYMHALAFERPSRIAGGAIQARHGHPGLPVLRRSAHGSLCANQAAPVLLGALGSVATKAPLTRRRGRWCASGVPLSVALLVLGSRAWAPSARMRVARRASWCRAGGPCGEQNTRSAVGAVYAQVIPLFTRPNWSSERTSKRRCLLAAAQLQR